jgi:flavin reductase (DIM6/NTAB) family NADH-FMN oxidoreductase RutF
MREFSQKDLEQSRSNRIVYSMPGHAPALVTTLSPNATVNVGVFEQVMLCSNVPPLIILAISPKSDTLHNLRDHGECVIGFPRAPEIQKVYDSGVRLPRGQSELDLINFKPLNSVSVSPPRLAECWFVAEGNLAWEQECGDHSACGILISHMAIDEDLWCDDIVERRSNLPALYYTTSGHFFLPGQRLQVFESKTVKVHGHAS